MGTVLRSSDLAEIFLKTSQGKMTPEEGQEKLILLLEPLMDVVACRLPLYVREDLKQEMRLDLLEKFKGYQEVILGNKSSWNFVSLFRRDLTNFSLSYMRAQQVINCHFVRIDDLDIEPAVFPKTYERTKLLKKIRRALEAFYRQRYPKDKDAERASRFAYSILEGKRPSLETNNLQKFSNGNRFYAQQSYTTALILIKQLLEKHRTEVECILEE